MEKDSIIGKTFAKSGIGNMVYIIVVTGFEKKGNNYDADSYVGKQTLIFPNGMSTCSDWACEKGCFLYMKKHRKLKRLR